MERRQLRRHPRYLWRRHRRLPPLSRPRTVLLFIPQKAAGAAERFWQGVVPLPYRSPAPAAKTRPSQPADYPALRPRAGARPDRVSGVLSPPPHGKSSLLCKQRGDSPSSIKLILPSKLQKLSPASLQRCRWLKESCHFHLLAALRGIPTVNFKKKEKRKAAHPADAAVGILINGGVFWSQARECFSSAPWQQRSSHAQPEEEVNPRSCSIGLYLHSSASSSSTRPASFSIRATCWSARSSKVTVVCSDIAIKPFNQMQIPSCQWGTE